MRASRALAAAVLISAGLAGCSGGGPLPASSSTADVAAVTREVTFSTAGTTTYGTLQVPARRRNEHLAAALLLAGSGATDRDGNQPPGLTPNTLRQIADALAGMGIISLRFDKYFAGRTGAGSYGRDPGSIDLDAFIRQAQDAYQLLRRQPETDQQRLLVVGHSEGGMYAILLATAAAPHPAGLALVEPQDERILDLVALQINETLDAQVSQGTLSVDAARQNAQGVRQAITQFRAGQPVDTSGLLPSVVRSLTPLILSQVNARYERANDAVDVPAYAAKLPAATRVLVTDGTADFNVPPSTIQPLVNALTGAGATGPGLRLLTGLDHELHQAGTPANGGTLDPAFLSALREWAQPYATKP